MGLVKIFLPRRDQIPKGLVKRVNFIVRMWMNPCDAPLVIYLETMWPAAIEAFITLIDFGIADLARNIFRPTGLVLRRKGPHGRGKRQKLTRRIQRKFGPLKRLQDRKIGMNLKLLWVIDTRLQSILLWFLFVDVASEFLYRWTSGLYCTEPCLMAAGPGAALAHTDDQVHLGLSGWDAQTWTQIDYERGAASVDPQVVNMGDGLWNMASGGTFKPTGPGTVFVRMRMRIPGHPEIVDETALIGVTQLAPADLLVSGIVQDPAHIIIETQSDPGGNYVALGSYVSVVGAPPKGIPLCPT